MPRANGGCCAAAVATDRDMGMEGEERSREEADEQDSEGVRWPPDAHDTVGCVSVDSHGNPTRILPSCPLSNEQHNGNDVQHTASLPL